MRIAPITNQPEFYHIPLIIIVIYLNLFSIYLTLITNNKEFILIWFVICDILFNDELIIQSDIEKNWSKGQICVQT